MLRNAPFRPLKFTIVVHREEIKGSKDTYRVDMIRDTDNAWMVDPDWVAFKRHIEAGPIGYNEEEDEIWWYRPDSGREVRIMDEGSFYDAIGTLLETFNSPRMWMQVEKKPVALQERFQNILKWQQDQMEMERMREHDYDQYRRTYC